jgi:hypothetical protein
MIKVGDTIQIIKLPEGCGLPYLHAGARGEVMRVEFDLIAVRFDEGEMWCDPKEVRLCS